MNVSSFQQYKQTGHSISMVTCYDHWSAKILNKSDIDCLLVGDSLAVVMHGFDSTVHATIEMMVMHAAAVARGATEKFIIADMPFLSCSKGLEPAMDAVQQLMHAGAHAVKIEGASHQLPLIKQIVEAGVPVMGHLGLTPQSIHTMGGHKVQGKNEGDAERLIIDAAALEAAGCFSLVLECIPTNLGRQISDSLTIPTIGIGAGPCTNGQVLVLQDLLGVNPEFTPKFLRRYANSYGSILEGVNHFHRDVVSHCYPSQRESYK